MKELWNYYKQKNAAFKVAFLFVILYSVLIKFYIKKTPQFPEEFFVGDEGFEPPTPSV